MEKISAVITRFRLNEAELRRFFKFAVVGLSGTVVDVVILSLLHNGLHQPTLLANTLSYSAGIVNNFILNRLWTFADARSKPVLNQFIQFVVVSVIGLVLNDLIVTTTEGLFRGLAGPNAFLPAKVIAIGIVFIWNFFANRVWTYNDAPVKAEP